jgi:hypothetical protein
MPRLAVVVPSLAFALLLPTSAHAQFGGLVKRAAERVVKKDNPSTSSSSQTPIDDAVVTHMLAGLKEEARVADSVGRASLAQNAEAVGQVDAFLKRYAEYATARDASRRAQQEYQACIAGPGAELAAMSQGQGAPPNAMAMAQRMERMSPEEREAFEAKMDKLEKEAKAAEKSGNVAEQQRIRREVQQLTGASMTPAAGAPSPADVKKMQAAGNRMQQCRMPTPYTGQAPDPVMVRPVVVENGVASLAPQATREIRDSASAQAYLTSLRSMSMGNAPIARGAQAAGIETGRYSLLRERMLYIYARSVMDDEAAHPSGFSDEEYAALESHRGEIVAAARRLKQLGAF